LEAKGRRQKAECRRQDDANPDNVPGILTLTDTDDGHAYVPKRCTPACRYGHVIEVKAKS
jgi:hypothetical protein